MDSVPQCVCVVLHAPPLQYFIGVTVLAMVPELPEIVNGIQFALQNNISLRFTAVYISPESSTFLECNLAIFTMRYVIDAHMTKRIIVQCLIYSFTDI